MNRCFGIVLFLLIFTLCGNGVWAINQQQDTSLPEEIRLEPQSTNLFKTNTPQTNSDTKDNITNPKEDVDLDEIEDELPENNNEVQSNLKPKSVAPEPHKELDGNLEAEYTFFSNFDLDKNNDNKIDENTLLGKMISRDIIRTDVPSYLLREELTFHPQKGPISKIQYYGAFNGHISSNWNEDNYTSTSYNFNFLQIGAIGKLRNTKTDFKVLVNPRGVHGRSYMQNFIADAYLINSSIPHHKLVVGYSRNQVGKEGGSSSYILPFVMRSQISRNFGSTRALGVRLIGSYDLIDYNIAFNSSDRFFTTWFAGPEFTGWVDLKPLGKTDGRYGKLIVGGGLNAGHNHTNYTVGSLYLGYKYKKLWSSFEFAAADGYNGSYVVDKKATGFYGTVGYKIHPRLQIIGRYDQFDPNRDVSGDMRREYTAGINYFIKGQALRLILNYIFCQNQNTEDSHRFLIGTQILL